jgi:uncharacterized protein
MKRNLKRQLFLIGIYYFACNYCVAQKQQETDSNSYHRFFYENGKIASEGTMREGRPDGYWKTYSLNGKIKSEGNRRNYELDSLWKFYDENGKITTEINYLNGKKNGLKRSWDATGFISTDETFVSDIKQGITWNYFPPEVKTKELGKIKSKTVFDKGKENGMAFEYDTNGNTITVLEYNYGVLKRQEFVNRTNKQGQKQGPWKDFYEDGKVKAERTFVNGKKSGYEKTFSSTGSLANIEKYEGDSLQKEAPELTTKLEVRNEYYEDGSVKKTGTYLYDLPEGIHKEYSREGVITAAKIYKEGNLLGEGLIDEAGNQHGLWTEYHSSGQVKGKGNYTNAIRTGEWVFYFPNGKIEQKGKYDTRGRPEGLWQWYYDNGTLLREENYQNGRREGLLTEWSDSGKVMTKGEYIDGLKEGKWVYEIQEYREEGSYKNDQKDGVWKSYFVDNNQLRFVGKFVEGIPDDKHTFYFHDGKLSEEGKYIMGNKDGKWEYFNPDGTILLTITFKNNREVKYDGVKVKPLLPEEGRK